MRLLLLSLAWLVLAFSARAEEVRLAALNSARYTPALDQLVASAIQDIRASKPDSALANVDRLIALRPDFKLAHLIKGDLLQAKAGNLSRFGAAPKSKNPSELNDLKDEARVRLLRYIDQPDPDKLPREILQLAPGQKYALLADASRARLYVFENIGGEPRLIRDYYVTVGKNGVNKRLEGDLKTPTGVYTVTREKRRGELTPFYGAGAFPLDYPNEWDRRLGNTGHGIWLHGVPPNTYSRPPKASEGCLVVANPDYLDVSRFLSPHVTPIVIADRTHWLDRNDWQAERQALLNTLESWRTVWQRQEVEAYLDHYTDDFIKQAGRGWVEAKRRNIQQKDWIRVSLSDLSLFVYPEGDLAVINLTQDYESDNLSDITRKRLYLQREQGRWRIALEKALQSAPALAKAD
ncbi:MAG: L,D-transpeptidase Cds6 family protein [Pseudomonadota bacterium]